MTLEVFLIILIYATAIWLGLLAATHRRKHGLKWYARAMAITVIAGDLLLLVGQDVLGTILAVAYLVLLIKSAHVLRTAGRM